MSWTQQLDGLDGRAGDLLGPDGLTERASVVAAAFRHRSSRAGDPLLHTHVLVANTARASDDGRWRTVDSRHAAYYASSHAYASPGHQDVGGIVEGQGASTGRERSPRRLVPVTFSEQVEARLRLLAHHAGEDQTRYAADLAGAAVLEPETYRRLTNAGSSS